MNNQRGITLMVVLVMIVVIGLSAGLAGQSWRSLLQREREAELLWRGDQYRKAIGSYYLNRGQGGAGIHAYPPRLEDLLRDPRSLAPVRHLRRLYPDPMTAKPFEILKDPAGQINGVRSTSEEEPFKKDGFPTEYQDFVNIDSYRGWEFRYKPPKVKPGVTPPATTTPGTITPGTITPSPSTGGVQSQSVTPDWPEGWTPWKMPGQ